MTDDTQMALIEAESDEALLLPAEELRKRFTGTTAIRVEQKRRHIVDLLAMQIPIDLIASRTMSSTRIVKLIGGICAEEVASNSLRFAQVLKAKAARFLFFAEQKAPDAKFGELMVGVGIAAQRAQEMEMSGVNLNPPDAAVELETENPALASARKFLAERNGSPSTTNDQAHPTAAGGMGGARKG